MTSPVHVRHAVKQIDPTSWIIGSNHIMRLVQGACEGDCLWANPSDGSHYSLYAAPVPAPDAGPLPPDSHVRQIHDAGDVSAVFSFGNRLIVKVRIANDDTLREPETLAFLEGKHLSFDIPTVLSYFEEDNKVYLFEPYVPGERLNEAWWYMSEVEKEHVTTRVSEICSELAAFKSDAMTRVDYNWLDPFKEHPSTTAQALKEHCEALGMDCSTFAFSHNDLGPTNIIVNGDRIAVIDFELAGYSPLAWVRTKFAVCGALQVERAGGAGVEHCSEYQVLVEQKLGGMGLPHVTEAYERMNAARYEEWKRSRPWLR